MTFDEKPRPSVGDTLRAALPMKWLIVLKDAMFLIIFVAGIWAANIVSLLRDKFGFFRDFADRAPLFILVSAVAAYLFLLWITKPYIIQRRQAREYSRQHEKVMAEHQEILKRWQRNVKPEGETQHET